MDGVHSDSSDGRQLIDAGIRRRIEVHEPGLAGQVKLLDGEERVAIFRTELGQTIGDHMHNSAWLDERVEAAAHSEVEREIVRRLRQRPRAPGGGCDHSDARNQHIDLVRAVCVAIDAQVARRHGDQALEKRSNLDVGRGDDQDAHGSSLPRSPDWFSCAASVFKMSCICRTPSVRLAGPGCRM